jgi:hypothetical protein
MFAIYALFMYGSGIAILGLMLLAYIPGLRLSSVNLLIFILGGFLGMFVIANLGVWGIRYLLEHFAVHREVPHGEIFGYFLVLVGAALGGAGLVGLKMHFVKARKNEERTASSR